MGSNTDEPGPSGSAMSIPLQTYDPGAGWQQVAGAEDGENGESLKLQALKLMRHHTVRFGSKSGGESSKEVPEPTVTENAELHFSDKNNAAYDGVYHVDAPEQTRGLLTEILSLYKTADLDSKQHKRASSAGSTSGDYTPVTSASPKGTGTGGVGTPKRKWYEKNRSQETLSNLIGASAKLANPSDPKTSQEPQKPGKRPGHKRTISANRLSTLLQLRQADEERVTVNIADILACQEYITKLCEALMKYGAPTHRLEEYLHTSANFLKIAGQFLYLPNCMIMSFDDPATHTTEVRLVRCSQSIDLGKLKETHHIYKEVIHDVIGADEGRQRLEALIARPDKFNAWLRVMVFGLTSLSAAPFSFGARLIDLPLLFVFGSLVGLLSLIVAPRFNLYANVFEISTTVGISFLARAFGSIRLSNGEPLFCFSALAQGGIVMLLPGYSVLCSSLELQSRAIVPGSIRIVYAIVYSLFLGFGITVGAMIWGLFDDNATSATTCGDPLGPYVSFAFVPLFVLCICMLYQAKWRQMPVMLVIAFAGYIINFFSSRRFTAAPQIANTIGAFAVGVLANLYSRLRHGVAAAILIPAIFTQVPGGLASTGGLISGLSLANEIAKSNSTTTSSDPGVPQAMNTVVFSLAASMIQIAIGIAVGLFMSALVIYPLGKRRSGLFSF